MFGFGIQNLDPSPVKEWIRACQLHEITLSDVVKAELYYGAYRSTRPPHDTSPPGSTGRMPHSYSSPHAHRSLLTRTAVLRAT